MQIRKIPNKQSQISDSTVKTKQPVTDNQNVSLGKIKKIIQNMGAKNLHVEGQKFGRVMFKSML
jgi:hypothetical protein